MTTLVVQAAWALVAAFLLSLIYEIYRATAKAGTSRHVEAQRSAADACQASALTS